VKKTIKVIVSIQILLILSLPLVAQDVLDGIVAMVGDEIILFSEWMQEAQGLAIQQGINPATQQSEFEAMKKAVLQSLINSRVLLAKAEEDTITVEDQQVEAELENKIQYFIQQLGSKEKVEAQFGKPIHKIKKDFFEEQKKLLIVNRVQQEKLQSVQISRLEVERFYEQKKDSLPQRPPMVQLSHILKEVRAGDATRQAALNQIRDIQKRLEAGEDFAELAKSYSQDPGSASNGGDLGFVERGTFVPEFEQAAFALKNGELSDIVESQFGLHIIQMIENRGDQIHTRHILIQMQRTESDESIVLQEIQAIRDSITLYNASFEEMARKHSDDQESSGSGGSLGWLPTNSLQIPEFRVVVDSMHVGKISQPFKTRFGFHLVRMEAKREAGPLQLDTDREQIHMMALNYKKQKSLQDWINELKKKMHIEIREDLL
jgi:peptidyl-prolyl cis-trans isomerase SurA